MGYRKDSIGIGWDFVQTGGNVGGKPWEALENRGKSMTQRGTYRYTVGHFEKHSTFAVRDLYDLDPTHSGPGGICTI